MGRVYGYIPREAVVHIKRLNAAREDDRVAGVTVVWLARHPSTGLIVIVGWYRNAVVHRVPDGNSIERRGGFSVKYQIDAPAADRRLLLLDQRTFEIPTKKEKGCLGQSPVWCSASDAFRARVRAFIDRDGCYPTPAKKAGRTRVGRFNDPEARNRIELAAVAYATRYYKSIEGGERTVRIANQLTNSCQPFRMLANR